MLRSRALILFSLLGTCSPTFAEAFSPAQIDKLLQNDDPRLIAFGASELLKTQYDGGMLVLLNKAEHWDASSLDRADGADWFDSMTVVLDTLIQRDETPSPAAVTAIAETFPAQALILVTRMPFAEAEPILLSWFEAGENIGRDRASPVQQNRLLLARIAAMLLARQRPADIAASLLADSTERLAVSVPDAGKEGIQRCLLHCQPEPACEERTHEPHRAGWPWRYIYVLEENPPPRNPAALPAGTLLVESGGDRILYRRVDAEMDTAVCSLPRFLDQVTRHHLIASMLGVTPDAMAWGPQMDMTLPWFNDSLYLRDLSRQVSEEENKLRSTVRELYFRKVLTQSQLTSTRPRLAIMVFDDRSTGDPAKSALPGIQAADTRTTCRVIKP